MALDSLKALQNAFNAVCSWSDIPDDGDDSDLEP